jgi:hypothetical protein
MIGAAVKNSSKILMAVLVFSGLAFFSFADAAKTLDFNGTDNYVSLPSMNIGSVFTVEAWIYPADDLRKETLFKDNFLGSNFGSVYRDTNNMSWGFGGDVPLVVPGIISDNWNHFSFVSDGTRVLFYVNGREQGRVTATPNFNNSLDVGRADPISIPADGDFWKGKIDSVRIYSRALTATEVNSHCRGTFSNESGIRGAWPFNEGSGTVATDSSGQGNNGTIVGASWIDRPEFAIECAPAPEVPAPVQIPVGQGVYINALPAVKFMDFPQEVVWAGKKTISYLASDQDPQPYGLKDYPISFYYSNDNGTTWKELAKNLANDGKYILDTTLLPDSQNYKLKIVVTDNAGAQREGISDPFATDNTPPTYEVFIPLAENTIREKDKITLKITSSEDLTEAPRVQVKQFGAESQTLSVQGSGKNFSASYVVLKGYLGTATVSVRGKDAVGNVGEKITAGGTFSVVRLGPVPPSIDNISDNESVSDPKISLQGKAPGAKQVVLVLNKTDRSAVTPADNGSFEFKDIVLSPLNFGYNTVSISGIDKDGIQSDERIITVKLNNPPKISWLTPPAGIISGVKNIEWLAQDPNNDKLVYSIFYSIDGGKNWGAFSSGVPDVKYDLNTTYLFDGDSYLLKVVADDGTAKAEIVSGKFTIKNNLVFSISIPQNYMLNTSAPVLTGNIKFSGNKIISLKYSLEKEEWLAGVPSDGKFDSLSEDFLIKFPAALFDGKHIIFIEAEDETGNLVKTYRQFIIDTVPPIAPRIVSPSLEETINAARDLDLKLGGIQINVSGRAEAGVELELVVNGRRFTAVADGQGDFKFENVTFLSHGISRYVLSSSDFTGNVSKTEGFVISNEPPEISILSPKKGDFMSGTKEIRWQASDVDGDQLNFRIAYRQKNKNWIDLVQDILANSYKFGVSKLSGGEYELKVTANDGFIDVSSSVTGIFADNILPTVSFDPVDMRLALSDRLFFSGTATDDLSGIQFVEYGIARDVPAGPGIKDWYKAIITEGYLKNKALFAARYPLKLEDGKYSLGARATDGAGNVSVPKFESIAVDRTAPRIGSYVLSRGSVVFWPEEKGFKILSKSTVKFAVSLEKDTQESFLSIGTQKIGLSKNKGSNLWEADINTVDTGEFPILITAQDAAGNRTEDKNIGSLDVIGGGHISFVDDQGAVSALEGVQMDILIWSEDSRSYVRWQAENYDEKNPIMSSFDGTYELLLPAGRYQISLQKAGFDRAKTNDIILNEPRFIDLDIVMTQRKGVMGFFENILEKLGF